jgi:SAM-dependent methyltransferase
VSRFFIRPDYIFNDKAGNITYDKGSNIYWSSERIKASEIFQYSVYKLVASQIRESKLHNPFIADVGCGAAYKGIRLLSSITEHYHGFDQPNVIEILKSHHPNISWFDSDFENDNLDVIEKYDFIICSDVIEHLVHPDLFLIKLKTLMKPQGTLFLSTPDRTLLRGKDAICSPNLNHVQEWSSREFDSFVEAMGFVIEDRFHLPPMRLKLHSLGGYFRHRLAQLSSSGLSWNYNYLLKLRL